MTSQQTACDCIKYNYLPVIFFLCLTPQIFNSLITLCSDWPCGVMEYSTVGGKVSNMVRFTSWFSSSSLSSLESILSVMPCTSAEICLNRLGPKDSEIIIGSFHLPLRTSIASLTGCNSDRHSE